MHLPRSGVAPRPDCCDRRGSIAGGKAMVGKISMAARPEVAAAIRERYAAAGKVTKDVNRTVVSMRMRAALSRSECRRSSSSSWMEPDPV